MLAWLWNRLARWVIPDGPLFRADGCGVRRVKGPSIID